MLNNWTDFERYIVQTRNVHATQVEQQNKRDEEERVRRRNLEISRAKHRENQRLERMRQTREANRKRQEDARIQDQRLQKEKDDAIRKAHDRRK